MKKKIVSLLLALTMCLGLLPAAASAAEASLPDWYFLFAIFKNVDADGKDKDGKAVHVTYSMSQKEVDIARENAQEFEEAMNSFGVMRAHVEVIEIDTPVTELYNDYSGGSYLSAELAAPLLEGRVDLDRYDHVTCIVSLNDLHTTYMGITGSAFENDTGHSCANFVNEKYALEHFAPGDGRWPPSLYIHEYLHFMERMSLKWGFSFGLHLIGDKLYAQNNENYTWKTCYTDIILNRVKGDAETGTGVYPAVWQYPPHVLRTMTALNVPSGATSIGEWAFANNTRLTRVTIPGSVTTIGGAAFYDSTSLTEVNIFPGVTEIGNYAFRGCSNLTRLSIPASVTKIGDVGIGNNGAKMDIYYSGTESQWKAIQIGEYNEKLTRANIHYNHLMADVKTTDWFAGPVMWALENGLASGTGNGNFSPNRECTMAEILTFLYQASGAPAVSGNPYSNVKTSDWYANAAIWAHEKGLVTGSAFNASAPCTRSTAVTCLWRLAGSPGARAAGFTDVPASASYAGAVNWAVEKGVTAGVKADQFGPDIVCTRSQIVTFLRQAMG